MDPDPQVIDEMVTFVLLLPLASTSLRARVSSEISCMERVPKHGTRTLGGSLSSAARNLRFPPACVMPWPKQSSGTSERSPLSSLGNLPIAPWSGS